MSGIYKIKGVGDVITGRVEQGVVTIGEECCFLPTHTASNACNGCFARRLDEVHGSILSNCER